MQAQWREHLNTARDDISRKSSVAASELRERVAEITTQATTRLKEVGGKINHLTGYEEIEVLKASVVEKGQNYSNELQAIVDPYFLRTLKSKASKHSVMLRERLSLLTIVR